MYKIKFLLAFLFLPVVLFGQGDKPTYGIKFSGYAKTDFFYDTRQTVNIREGHFLLYPSPESLDAAGEDINAEPSFNFLSIQTRLTGNISAPDAFGAKVTGVIEADFFGNENAAFVDANGFRLRHAYAKLTWEKTELLFGQFWHPLFIPSSFSDVISFNTGAPFQPFSRNPQMRITHKLGDFSLMAALCAQRDFTSPAGSLSLRNAAMPEVQGQFQYEKKATDGNSEFLTGIGGGIKSLRPFLTSEKLDQSTNTIKKYLTDETVSSFSSTFYMKYKKNNTICKLQAVYGQNLFDMTMLGGYGIKEILNASTNKVAYSPLNTFSGWTEFITKFGQFQVALWAGYTEILGSDDKLISYTNKVGGTDATLRGTSADNSSAIKNILRVSPRVVLTSEKINLAFELEYTSAGYATKDSNGKLKRDEFGVITETKNIANIRPLFSVILKF
jgi:hypothetical protein